MIVAILRFAIWFKSIGQLLVKGWKWLKGRSDTLFNAAGLVTACVVAMSPVFWQAVTFIFSSLRTMLNPPDLSSVGQSMSGAPEYTLAALNAFIPLDVIFSGMVTLLTTTGIVILIKSRVLLIRIFTAIRNLFPPAS